MQLLIPGLISDNLWVDLTSDCEQLLHVVALTESDWSLSANVNSPWAYIHRMVRHRSVRYLGSSIWDSLLKFQSDINGLTQGCCSPIANALEILQSWIKPSTWRIQSCGIASIWGPRMLYQTLLFIHFITAPSATWIFSSHKKRQELGIQSQNVHKISI